VNLGQGFPNWDPPAFVVKSMEETVNVKGTSTNQYCRPQCHLPLAQALADDYNSRPSWASAGVRVDPATNVVSSLGVTQIMYIAFRSLIKKDDEVVLLEPAFDIYAPQVLLTGGTPRFVR
jgi:kynurenine--oxoglutarate transaminase/cysteine-S-conjugate beta-lyase/glutamine--phenylpyruvate transaminase